MIFPSSLENTNNSSVVMCGGDEEEEEEAAMGSGLRPPSGRLSKDDVITTDPELDIITRSSSESSKFDTEESVSESILRVGDLVNGEGEEEGG